MQCPQCQHANRDARRFCAECGVPLAGPCTACGFVNDAGDKFCGGCGRSRTAPRSAATRSEQGEAETESRFHALLGAVLWMLQRERRVTYRELAHVLGLDEAMLAAIRQALAFKRLARDEEDQGLVWTGEEQRPAAQPSQADLADTADVQSPVVPMSRPGSEAGGPSNGAPSPLETFPRTAPTHDEPVETSASCRRVPDAERRQLTVMFCDLTDSTTLSQQLDAEDLREVVRAYQATAAEVIHQYEGHIAQYLGDGVLVYFGWTTAHEDDAQRALHAGLGIVDAITTTLNPRLERDHGVQLTVRLGIHTGSVVVGDMGGRGRQEHLATGDTVNIAARLEGLAAPDTVVVSGVTARLVQGVFVLADLGPQALKGVAEPLHVFRVLGPLEAHEDETSGTGVPFLVGREEEVGLLRRRWEQSKAGLGQVVLLSGEAGIGKSSLVTTLRRHVREEGYPCLTFRCSPYHTNSALYPVLTHLEHLLRFDRDDTPATRLDRLEQALRTTSLPLEEALPLVATLLSLPVSARYPVPTMSPQRQRQQTLDTLVGWLLTEAERQPVLAVWEDLHWADPSTLELLGLVLEQTPTVPMLHVLTFRPEFTPPWPSRSHMTPMTLTRLERPQAEALLTHLAGGKGVPSEVVEHIVTKTDGVPLYVEELTRMLLDSELLREEADRYVQTGPLATVAIPDTLQDSLMARLDQLQTAKEVAQMGAVLGREFAYEMLQAIASQDEESLQASLAQLVDAELLYQRGRPPRARYIFKHALIQDAAYASLLRSTRQRVHQQIAQMLEARLADTVEMQPELVAHHYTEAGCHEQAVINWQQAGQRALQRSANPEAVQHLTKGLDLLATLSETTTRVQQELDLRVALGPAMMATKGWAASEVEQNYARARTLCQQAGETPHLIPVLRGLGRFYGGRGALRTAHELNMQLLTLAQREAAPLFLLEAHEALGNDLFFLGEYSTARVHLEQALALADPKTQRELMLRQYVVPGVTGLAWMAVTLWCLGYPAQAEQRSQEALTLAQSLHHPQSLALVRQIAAYVHQRRRETSAVLEHAEALVSLGTAQQFPLFVAFGTYWRGWGFASQGQQEEGRVQIYRGLEDALALGQVISRTTCLVLLAEVAGHAGQIDEGLRLLAEALTEFEANERRDMLTEVYRLRGEFLRRQPVPDAVQAETCFQQALDIARRQQAKSWELRAATSLARLWQRQGKRQAAYDLLAPVYGWFTEGFDTADLKDAKALLDELSEGR